MTLRFSLPAGMLALCSLTIQAQFTPQNDPANLSGERVSAPELSDTLPINHGPKALEQLLRKVRTRASFLLIVAHPDDEDSGMLTYLSRGQGARVGMLTLTRGEGGQNFMSADFEDALGLIRTQELLAADRYMSVDQFFGTEVDFGFSKTKEEAFKKWTHDRVLYDAVRAVRLYRPLVIGAVFIGAPSDGHGQHQVSGQIAQEVFKAAGDPKVFPDQIAAGLKPWQPLKVYARIPMARIDEKGMFDYATNQYVKPEFTNYVTGKVTSTLPKTNVVVPEGTPDSLLDGLTYVQFARRGLALHKSQIAGGNRPAPTGKFDVNYHRYGSALQQADGDEGAVESSFFDGIDTSLAGMASLVPSQAAGRILPTLQRLDAALAKAQHDFDASHPEAIAPVLHDALGSIDTLMADLQKSSANAVSADQSFNVLHELRIKRVQLNNALVLARGIGIDSATLNGASMLVTDQTSATVNIKIANGTEHALPIKQVTLTTPTNAQSFGPESAAAAAGSPGSVSFDHLKVTLPQGIPATRPYFERRDIEQPYYDLQNAALRNAPMSPYPLTATVTFDDAGVPLMVSTTVSSAATAGSSAALPEPVKAVPPVSVALSRHAQVLASMEDRFHTTMTVSPANLPVSSITLEGAGNWRGTLDPLQSTPGHPTFTVVAPAGARKIALLTGAVKFTDGKTYTEGLRAVGYAGIPATNFFGPATMRVVPVDVTTAEKLNIAYVSGTGDDVPMGLEQLGVTAHVLKPAEITADTLKGFDAVVLGVRPYEAHADLAAANPALLAYTQGGGVVILQYVARELPAGTGPYPLTLGSNERVVEEDTPVQLLQPGHPLLTWPNKITAADFSGWVEERGHGFMEKWDPHYEALTETHDQGEPPQRGGLLVARTGRGAWIYLAYALYRQLPEGVPGAYRLFANLISASKNPQFAAAP